MGFVGLSSILEGLKEEMRCFADSINATVSTVGSIRASLMLKAYRMISEKDSAIRRLMCNNCVVDSNDHSGICWKMRNMISVAERRMGPCTRLIAGTAEFVLAEVSRLPDCGLSSGMTRQSSTRAW
jgi:hypothetical protein